MHNLVELKVHSDHALFSVSEQIWYSTERADWICLNANGFDAAFADREILLRFHSEKNFGIDSIPFKWISQDWIRTIPVYDSVFPSAEKESRQTTILHRSSVGIFW